jgi:broad specificity phosphatase PhoE
MTDERHDVWLVRHGETEWSASGRHTGRTDVPLTEQGEAQARSLASLLDPARFALVVCSPRQRARDTCRLAGFTDDVTFTDDVVEWDYGEYEGRTTTDIRKEAPGWSLWRDGVPDGETAIEIGARADRVIERLRGAHGDSIVFSHGHFLRVFGARWIALKPTDGERFALSPATISILGWEREVPVFERWNATQP